MQTAVSDVVSTHDKHRCDGHQKEIRQKVPGRKLKVVAQGCRGLKFAGKLPIFRSISPENMPRIVTYGHLWHYKKDLDIKSHLFDKNIFVRTRC